MIKQLDKKYDPKAVEDRLYSSWCEKGYFTPKMEEGKKPFTIVIPPPNVTGQLHMGHALDNTLQDILIRTKRMQGYNTLWVPGTDHAGIATQIKVEENLRVNEGLSRHDLGREAFIERVWEWKNLYGSRIINQLKKLGSSCDWTRERFTMDETCSKAVKKVFVSLYEKGWIYRGYRIINWCPKCATALSDTEVEHKDVDGNFWHIKYRIAGTDDYLVIATTRPETMLGDTGIAVNPNDERYKHLVGKTAILPLMDREIPIVADDYVDLEFGTGCVKMTPCHDPNDFEVAKRHNLEMIVVLDDKAKVNENGGKYQGMDRYEARKAILADLDELGLLVKVEPHSHAVGHCYRCGTVVEPLSSRQWFVKMEELAKPAIAAVKEGKLRFVPERFSKMYLNWMENIIDWCISRQLWWGHRIPAYYCADCGEMVVAESDVHVCPKCGSKNMSQEEDVLDTWFSSALWPFSTLGWPEKTTDLETFYPTSVLVTGYDIISFWVSKMIFQGLEMMKEVPFHDVFIHGLVRDSQGRKMSKSLGNGIDPLEIIDQYGADALRFTLATGNSPGNDMRFYMERVEASRNFANKIWNAARFVLMNLTEEYLPDSIDTSDLAVEDKWIVSKYNTLVKDVTENIEKYELGIAVAKLYDFIWDIFCDWYIELCKPRLGDKDSAGNKTAQKVLTYVLSNTLKLLHPFMPFITEEIWQTLPHSGESIVISSFPVYDEKLCFEKEEEEMGAVIEAIKAIRNRRAEMNVPPAKRTHIFIKSEKKELFEGAAMFFEKLAGASSIEMVSADFENEDAVQAVTFNAVIYLPLAELVDFEAEKARLNKELETTLKEIEGAQNKLGNAEFVARAPEAVVNAEKEKLKKFTDKAEQLRTAIEKIKA
ncbi:MAG: valine--tRNA ligase [Clostridia bacterium]|nr:valine--tRNA ligase [Clostridia bacterium]